MTRLLLTAVAVLLLAPALTACSDACEELADLACQRAGENSDECKRIRETAARPSVDDKRACTLGLKVWTDFASKQ